MTFMFPTGEPPFDSAWCSQLVDAVVAAHDGDESLHVEWKSSLDLTSKAGRSAVAKAIIAFANRDPEDAQRAARGYGVLVVGAGPGRVAGIEQADPADWEPELRRLLGVDGPQYEVHWVPRNDRWVLVVLVSPPRPGDPIHYPRRTSGAVISGHPVIRRPGQSVHPDADEMDRLQARSAVALTYSLTVHGVDGVRRGEMSVEVEEAQVSIDEIIERWAPDWLTAGLT